MRLLVVFILTLFLLSACQSSGDAVRLGSSKDSSFELAPPRLIDSPHALIVHDVVSADMSEHTSILLNDGSLGSLITDGNFYVLTGKNFAYKVPARPMLWDTLTNQQAYDSYILYQDISFASDSPWSSMWCFSLGPCTPIVFWPDDSRVDGVASYAIHGSGMLMRASSTQKNSDYLYVNWWMRSNQGLPSGDMAQLLSVGVADDLNSFSSLVLFENVLRYPSDANHDGVMDVPLKYASFSWPENDLDWHNIELSVDLSQGADFGYGKVFVTIDGVRVTAVSDLWSDSSYSAVHSLGFGLRNPDAYSNSGRDVFLSELYFDTSSARVMLCDASVYKAVSHCELQIPDAEWKKGALGFVAHKGSFSHDEQVYVYVISSSGAVNANGFPVRIAA